MKIFNTKILQFGKWLQLSAIIYNTSNGDVRRLLLAWNQMQKMFVIHYYINKQILDIYLHTKSEKIWLLFTFVDMIRVKNWALIISCYVLALFFIHTTSTCIDRLGDICNVLHYSNQYLIFYCYVMATVVIIILLFLQSPVFDSIMSIVVPNFAQIGGFLYFGSHFGLKTATIANWNGRNMVQHVLLPVNIHFHWNLFIFDAKKRGFKKKLDSFHQTSWNFVGIFTVVCGSFWRVEKIPEMVAIWCSMSYSL
jgi:hypothetical protein